jgi:hypothetical protein
LQNFAIHPLLSKTAVWSDGSPTTCVSRAFFGRNLTKMPSFLFKTLFFNPWTRHLLPFSFHANLSVFTWCLQLNQFTRKQLAGVGLDEKATSLRDVLARSVIVLIMGCGLIYKQCITVYIAGESYAEGFLIIFLGAWNKALF